MAFLLPILLLGSAFPLLTSGEPTSCPAPVNLVYQFEKPTWIENLAVRANGEILLAEATSGKLTQLDPVTGKRQTVVDKSHVGSAIMSITSVVPDLFLINTLYCNLTILEVSPLRSS
jgi:hypothetical protein